MIYYQYCEPNSITVFRLGQEQSVSIDHVWSHCMRGLAWFTDSLKRSGPKKIFENVGNNSVEEKGFNDEWSAYTLSKDILDSHIV